MSLLSRIKKLERELVLSCPGCEPRQITWHQERLLPSGERVIFPPLPAPRPPCTCRPPRSTTGITAFIIHLP
jgi:hypothetical protein